MSGALRAVGGADEVEVVDDGERHGPLPRAIGRNPLNNVQQVREEMARVYRSAARGSVTTKTGAQLVYMLQALLKAIEVEQVETKLDALVRHREEMDMARKDLP